ncbi:MAG: DUF455 family protein [Planctomycetia bacterium]|nr:DUF455 family protein [Planctomycetia bacterium]
MELREFAERILRSESLEAKLARAEEPLTDERPGDVWRPEQPVRSAELQFAPRRTAPSMPKLGAFKEAAKRAVAHHIMANHELQALEVMASVLVAFPDAPSEFRKGMVAIMGDEQRHTRMHLERAANLGLPFGSLRVNCYIWKKSQQFESVLDYLAGLPLVFEGANLDHTLEFADAFEQAGDLRSAALMRTIHRDEIQHVAFGMEWLRRLKSPDQSDWDAFQSHLKWPLRAEKARGEVFQREARRAAGMSEEFISQLELAGIADSDGDKQ